MASRISKNDDGSVSVKLKLADMDREVFDGLIANLQKSGEQATYDGIRSADRLLDRGENFLDMHRGLDFFGRRVGYDDEYDRLRDNAVLNASSHRSRAVDVSRYIGNIVGALEAATAYKRPVTLAVDSSGHCNFTFGDDERAVTFWSDDRNSNSAISNIVKSAAQSSFPKIFAQLERQWENARAKGGKDPC